MWIQFLHRQTAFSAGTMCDLQRFIGWLKVYRSRDLRLVSIFRPEVTRMMKRQIRHAGCFARWPKTPSVKKYREINLIKREIHTMFDVRLDPIICLQYHSHWVNPKKLSAFGDLGGGGDYVNVKKTFPKRFNTSVDDIGEIYSRTFTKCESYVNHDFHNRRLLIKIPL